MELNKYLNYWETGKDIKHTNVKLERFRTSIQDAIDNYGVVFDSWQSSLKKIHELNERVEDLQNQLDAAKRDIDRIYKYKDALNEDYSYALGDLQRIPVCIKQLFGAMEWSHHNRD